MQHWHLDKKISIGHIFTTVAVAASVVTMFSSMDKDVSLNSQAIQHLTAGQHRNRERIEVIRAEIRDDLKALDNKLDKVLEKL